MLVKGTKYRAGLLAGGLLLLSFATSAVAGNGNTKWRAVQKRFDPEGQLLIKGGPPEGMAEVSSINLYRNTRGQFRHPDAGVSVTNGRVFRFQTVSVSRKRLAFTTTARGGVSYRFAGRFLKGGVFAEAELDPEAVVLVGQMGKYRNGRKVAEGRMRFTYFGGT